MITKNDIQQLVNELEEMKKICRKAGVETQDCIYAIGDLMIQSEINLLKEALEGKIKLTKANVLQMIKNYDEAASKLASEANKDTEDLSLAQGYYFSYGKVKILKEIYKRFYTEIKHRVSRKQRITEIKKEILEMQNKIENYSRECRPFYVISGELISCQKVDRFTGDFIEQWCIKNIRDCQKDDCMNYNQFIKHKTEYIELISSLDNKIVELKKLEEKKCEEIGE